jgi:DNA-binding NarL/FixJ family response regulator
MVIAVTKREYQVLALLANGRTIDGVARELGLHPQTVKNHLASAYKRLRVTNRAQAYMEMGWMTPPEIR